MIILIIVLELLFKNATENGKTLKIIAARELLYFYKEFHSVPEDARVMMNKGSLSDFGFCTVGMVHADHSSTCNWPDGKLHFTGPPLGFIVQAAGKILYHAGDTNVFSDMEIISELYEPDYALLPIGGLATIGPKEAAYALAKYLK